MSKLIQLKEQVRMDILNRTPLKSYSEDLSDLILLFV